MYSLTDKLDAMFASNEGERLYKSVGDTVASLDMDSLLRRGVAVGFSGGPDSVMLLSYLVTYRRKSGSDFPIVAVHVNHGIRGKNADRDAELSCDFCISLGVEFVLREVDVPALAKESGTGIEEAARNARYSVFEDIIRSREDISVVALAHNSTDNVETVLMNLLRGSGVRGMCGIPPVRDYVVRPLIDIPKSSITSLLDSFGIPYTVDESNDSDEYTRNYIRHHVLPHLSRVAPSFDKTVGRTVENMRSAYSFISECADAVLADIPQGSFEVGRLRGLHYVVFADVFSRLALARTGTYPEGSHIKRAFELVGEDSFSLSLSGGYDFISQRGVCIFKNKNENSGNDVIITLALGENRIQGTNATVVIEDGPVFRDFSTNIYKFSIYARVKSDIICKGLHIRFRRDGDSYRTGGITRRLKKVFNDRNIPPFMRDSIPIICDEKGIVWVPGLGVRDDVRPSGNEPSAKITVLFENGGGRELFTALPYKFDTNI